MLNDSNQSQLADVIDLQAHGFDGGQAVRLSVFDSQIAQATADGKLVQRVDAYAVRANGGKPEFYSKWRNTEAMPILPGKWAKLVAACNGGALEFARKASRENGQLYFVATFQNEAEFEREMDAQMNSPVAKALGFVVMLVLLAIWTFWPVASVMLAARIAAANGCSISEVGASACVVWGYDIGWLLYAMGMMGWFMLVTIPTGALGLLALLIATLFGGIKSLVSKSAAKADAAA